MHETTGRLAAPTSIDANRAAGRESVQPSAEPTCNISDRDRAMWAYIAEHPGVHPREIASGLNRPFTRIRARLAELTTAGYLRRTGASWSSSYKTVRPLPERSPFAKRTCVDCGGRWQPSREHAGTRCVACRRLREALGRAQELGVDGLQVIVRPLKSRARAPHPLQPGELVWIDTAGDVEAIAGDRNYAMEEAIAA